MIDSLLDLLTENQWWAILIVASFLILYPGWTVAWSLWRRSDSTIPWVLPELLCTLVSVGIIILLWNVANQVLWLWAN